MSQIVELLGQQGAKRYKLEYFDNIVTSSPLAVRALHLCQPIYKFKAVELFQRLRDACLSGLAVDDT